MTEIDSSVFQHCKLVQMRTTEFMRKKMEKVEGGEIQIKKIKTVTLPRGKNKFRGFSLDKSIHLYRIWFFLVKAAYECEKANLKFGSAKEHSVKLNKSFYRDWEIEKYLDNNFDYFFLDKIHLFGVEGVSLVDEIHDTNNFIYLKIRKNSRLSDVVRQVQVLLKDMKFQSQTKYQIKKEHKYIYVHQQYNVFLMKQSGWSGSEISSWLQKYYGGYTDRIASTGAAMRKLYRASEQLILDVAKGDF